MVCRKRINSINIINLKRRPDLEEAQREVWAELGASSDQIVFHEAVDGLDYESREALAADAQADGFEFIVSFENFWMGLGEMALVWSASRVLREIANSDPTEIHFYVVADYHSTKPVSYLEEVFARLPDFSLLQFSGVLPIEMHGRKNEIFANYAREYVPGDDVIPENTIEIGNTKLGECVLAMTSVVAQWMLDLQSLSGIPAPYEYILWREGFVNQRCPKGAYSLPFFECSEDCWQAEFPPPLSGEGNSDILKVNSLTKTGMHYAD